MPIVPTTAQAYKFFHEGTLAFSQMEARGIKIDTAYLSKTIESTSQLIKQMEGSFRSTPLWSKWQRRFGERANVQSPAQLGKLLNSMGYKSLEKTDKGNDKWDERTVESISKEVPELAEYVEMKKLKKANTTYLKGIQRETDSNGFLHPSYNLAGGLEDEQKGGARSYRSSSSNPNFTNMPIRNKVIGRLIRETVIGYDDYLLGEIDHSTIEVRVAGAVTGDEVLVDYVKNSPPKDMHTDRAMELFLLTKEQVGKKTTRDASKNKFVFPQFYGDYYLSCAKSIWEAMERGNYAVEGEFVKEKIKGKWVKRPKTVKEHLFEKGIKSRGACIEGEDPKKGTFEYRVKEVQDIMWNDVFKEYTAWKKRLYAKYLKTGIVELPTGFVARGPYRKNQVLNLPIQGPAFHILLWGIIELQKELKRLRMKSHIVGQIHDCILPYIHKKEIQPFLNLANEVMTERIRKHWKWITVPLKIEVDIVPQGKSWADKAAWEKHNEHWAAV